MSRFTPGPWLVKEENGSYGVFSNDALLAITLSDDIQDKDAEKANAHLMATAPRLLEIIKEIKEHLDNNMIVTEEGLKINDSHLRESIIDAILRAEGYRLWALQPIAPDYCVRITPKIQLIHVMLAVYRPDYQLMGSVLALIATFMYWW
jgi:hypothetical protein